MNPLYIAVLMFGLSDALAATTFVDLTVKEYKGPDADLSGFSLTKFGVNCEENGTYVAGQDPYVSWEDHSSRAVQAKPGFAYLGGPPILHAKGYTIHFRIKDRKENTIHEEDFYYDGHTSTWPYKGRVIWGNPEINCDRSAVRFSKKIDLSFATVEYWAKKIDWNKPSASVSDADSNRGVEKKVGIGKPTLYSVWQSESKAGQFFESSEDCKNESNRNCIQAVKSSSELVGKFRKYKGSEAAYVFQVQKSGEVLRTGLFASIEQCNKARKTDRKNSTKCYLRDGGELP